MISYKKIKEQNNNVRNAEYIDIARMKRIFLEEIEK